MVSLYYSFVFLPVPDLGGGKEGKRGKGEDLIYFSFGDGVVVDF